MYHPIIRPIKPEILEWFLSRELESFEWMKNLPEEELDRQISELVPRPVFVKPLFKEQKVMFLLGALESNFIFWASPGTGKTALALNLINYRYEKNKPALVLVPDLQNIENWLPECKLFVPHLKAIPLAGTREQRLKDLQKNGDIYIVNYDGINSILNSSAGKSISINPGDVANFAKNFKTVIYDEAQPLDVKILTPNGWCFMGDLEKGNLIIGIDGNSYPILNINYKGKQKIAEITFSDKSKTRCSLDHLWEVVDHNGYKTKILRTSDILKTKLKYNASYRYHIPRIDKPTWIKCISEIKILDKEEEVQCISTNAPRNLYITDDLIVTHNCVEVKNSKSISFQVGKVLSKYIPYRYGLTGRPFGRVALDLWAQFYVIDGGATLGKNLEIFKQSFFKPKITPFTIKWIPDDEKLDKFHKTLQNKAIYFPPVPLPEPIRTTIEVELSEEAKIYYRKLKGSMIADLKEDAWKAKIKNPFVKFRQICSGYLLVSDKDIDEDTGLEYTIDTQEIVFDNPKDKIIEKLISILPAGKKMVIFYAFTPSGKRITNKLDSMKVPYVWLWGQTKNKDEVLNEFKNNPKCRIMVTNLKSGSIGLNLQAANYEVWYENADSTMVRVQGEARCWRRGQTDQVYIYDIRVRNSIEKKIQEFVDEGRVLFEKLVEGQLSDTEKKKLESSFLTKFKSKKGILEAIGDL